MQNQAIKTQTPNKLTNQTQSKQQNQQNTNYQQEIKHNAETTKTINQHNQTNSQQTKQ